ncbi:MAG: GTP cyclohydrolase I FolE [candidate division Zixibacteria bacterium]|nr:GTP cyclohydrolase I FolE [candidate division Zixibacteria bacterium]
MKTEEIFRSLLEKLGKDVNPEALKNSPGRAARAFEYLTKGYNEDIEKIVNGAIFKTDTDEIILVKNIELYSLCEHHLLPFIGKCHVGYLPKGKVLGLSKVARIVEVFARRIQLQEKLTKQIADAIMEITGARGVGVVIEAQHLCMMMRGVEKQNSVLTTSCVLGEFRENDSTRAEFLSLIR